MGVKYLILGLENIFNIKGIFDKISSYLEARLELFKLEAKEEVSHIIAKALLMLVIAGAFTFFLLFASVAASIYIGEYLDSYFYGFMIVGGVYIVIMLLIIMLRSLLNLENLIFKILDPPDKLKNDE